MQYLKNYLTSFKLKSMFIYTLTVDALTWLTIGGLFYLLSVQLKNRLNVLTGGMSPEAFKQHILSLSPEQAQLFAMQLKVIVVQLAVFIIVLPIVALLLYSLSRAILWNMLLDKKFVFRHHWKWNLLNIVMLFIAVGLFLLFLVVTMIIGLVISSQAVNSVLAFLLVVCFFVLLFLICRNFTNTPRVFESVGAGFKALKQKEFYVAWLFGAATLFILRFVLYPFREQLFIYQDAALVAGAVIVLLWLSWFRMYVVSALREI